MFNSKISEKSSAPTESKMNGYAKVERVPEQKSRLSSLHDQLLQICLGTMHKNMDSTLATMLQHMKTLENSLSDEQQITLTKVQKQAQTLQKMIDGLLYIVNDSPEK